MTAMRSSRSYCCNGEASTSLRVWRIGGHAASATFANSERSVNPAHSVIDLPTRRKFVARDERRRSRPWLGRFSRFGCRLDGIVLVLSAFAEESSRSRTQRGRELSPDGCAARFGGRRRPGRQLEVTRHLDDAGPIDALAPERHARQKRVVANDADRPWHAAGQFVDET